MTSYTDQIGVTIKEVRDVAFAFTKRNDEYGDNVPNLTFDNTAIYNCFNGIQFEEFTTPEEIDRFYGEGFFDKWVKNAFKATKLERIQANAMLGDLVYMEKQNGCASPSHEDLYTLSLNVLKFFDNSNLIIVPHKHDKEYPGTLWFI